MQLVIKKGKSYPIVLWSVSSILLVFILTAIFHPAEPDYGLLSALPFFIIIAIMMTIASVSTRRVTAARKTIAEGICYNAEILEFIKRF